MIQIAPSILAADFSGWGRGGFDGTGGAIGFILIMDSHYVPNLSLDPWWSRQSDHNKIPFDVHLMDNPMEYVDELMSRRTALPFMPRYCLICIVL